MSSLRSDRAKRRAARLRSTRLVIIIVLIAVILAVVYFLWFREAPAVGSLLLEIALPDPTFNQPAFGTIDSLEESTLLQLFPPITAWPLDLS